MKNGGECGRIESQDDMRGGGERDPRDANGREGGYGRELRSITQDGTNAGVRDWARGREKRGGGECGESERRQQLYQ